MLTVTVTLIGIIGIFLTFKFYFAICKVAWGILCFVANALITVLGWVLSFAANCWLFVLFAAVAWLVAGF